ncbi:PREDICTED: interferon-induced guanylate-binding protein 1-like [Haliaeetus leucocephalus]|uniref:interferon-induced guanylate-binding protein 1-like n=1 Tax=Haliaeetus leucocephalus TaxID=52644 RepID=UPI00053CAC5F|nr:PREDICTED: interferon-induced guanylate-binding protein 1-like [Haliaeetus leucocephalus]XP_010569530.1 PREDICTED: interferon-induced guanylate-binding protein 1-like [Haliaeetus leucocephalus]
MASETHMPVPVCLIENTPARGLVVRPEALQVLSKITQPVVVVAITGLYRTGKSYLMNRLAGQRRGFSLGSTVQSHTKGIWMWCVPHPCRPGHTLVLLDTEGLGDVEKGDTRNDTWIFVLTILLSSTLIYNSRGTIDQLAMDQLHYVVKLTDHVKLKAAPKESEDELDDSEKFVLFFPTFIWAVRDFTLQLEAGGKEISEDEYLEEALKLKADSNQETQYYNQPRECIRQFFPDRKCFVFEQPARRRDLVCLEDLQDDEINPEFQQQVEKFCSHVWEKSPPKTVPGGHIITGNLLGKLATTYVETIQSGAVPCLESAVLALAEIENAAAVKEAVTLYQDLMAQRAKLPTETVQELLELHSQCEQEALELFMARAFKDGICRFQADLITKVEAVKAKFCKDNEQASHDKCKAALRDLSQDMEKRISDGVYNVSGGYELFKEDQQALVEKYWELPRKGVKADAVLQEFLQSRKTLAESILNTDRSLTEKDRELKSEQEQHERAEQERAVQRQKEAEERQKLEDQLRSWEKHVLQLRKKLENCSEKQLEEQQKMIRHKSKEAVLLKDGFCDKATHLHMVTSRLQQEYGSTRRELPMWINIMVSILLGLVFVVFRFRTPRFF